MNTPPLPDPPSLSEQEREQLTAYLDNELDEAATQELTAAMSRRPEVRREATTLRKTWELLDYLPRPAAAKSFTEATLTRLESTRGILLRQGARWRRFAIAGWAACLLVAALGGFLLTYSWNRHAEPDPPEVLVHDVVPAEPPIVESTSGINPETGTTSASKPRRDKEKPALRPWQQVAIQRNEKLRKELENLVSELRPKMKREDLVRLNVASREGGLGYIILVIDLARKYQLPLPDLLPTLQHDPPGKRPGRVEKGAANE